MPPKPLMNDEFAAFLESGLSIVVGVRDDALRPDGARAWALKVHEDRAHVTTYLLSKAAPALLEILRSHPEIAMAIDRPTDARACQVKGVFVASRRARVAERSEVERQVEGFLTHLEALGIPRALTGGWEFWPCVAIDLRITEIFEQTPGPGAGEPMR